MLKYVLVAIALLSFFVSPANGQSKPAPANAVEARLVEQQKVEQQKLAAERETLNGSSPDDVRQRVEQAGIAHVIAERQAQLRRDTDKLVALTAELKEHVAKTGPNILSMDVVKKAAEIQKLAKSVEEKMKNAY